MIDEVLVFLKDQLNAHLNSGWDPDESREEKVVFVDGEKMDPLSFRLGAVSVLLINVEEEGTLRAPDRYARMSSDGTSRSVQPEIRLNLYVLFVARFKQYEEALRHLSMVIQYFQNHRVLDRHSAPDLSEDIGQLVMELITLPFSEQNEVWNALRITYHPSVLYKAKMLVFRDGDARAAPGLTEQVFRISP